jgi:hypothetical protein
MRLLVQDLKILEIAAGSKGATGSFGPESAIVNRGEIALVLTSS